MVLQRQKKYLEPAEALEMAFATRRGLIEMRIIYRVTILMVQ